MRLNWWSGYPSWAHPKKVVSHDILDNSDWPDSTYPILFILLEPKLQHSRSRSPMWWSSDWFSRPRIYRLYKSRAMPNGFRNPWCKYAPTISKDAMTVKRYPSNIRPYPASENLQDERLMLLHKSRVEEGAYDGTLNSLSRSINALAIEINWGRATASRIYCRVLTQLKNEL